jgi:hypothetical protein
VPLSGFGVVQDHSQQDHVLVHCFDGANTVLVFIAYEVVDTYFGRNDLSPDQRNLLISGNIEEARGRDLGQV